jgi:pimeloyl-ACP methyl ester carboxylesterase
MKWNQFDTDQLFAAETHLIHLSAASVHKRIVWLPEGNALVYYEVGQHNSRKLVMLHGYLGGALLYFKLFKELSRHFHVLAFDLLGMGSSSRPTFSAVTLEEAEAFFVDSLRIAFNELGLTHFLLLGHSFGGYVAGCYAEQFPEQVAQLVLLSPVGYTPKTEGYSFNKGLMKFSWGFRMVAKTLNYLWQKNITPASVLRLAGPFSNRCVKAYCRRRLRNVPDEELLAIENYLEMINLLEGSGEYALVKILETGAWARRPMCYRLEGLAMPMSFLFGEHDWMSARGAKILLEAGCQVNILTVEGAGHQLFLENPEGVVELVLGEIRM